MATSTWFRRGRRTETRTRIISKTIDGTTHLVPEKYEVEVPTIPRDWDLIVLHALVTIAVLVGIGAVAWSTNALGALLSAAAFAPIAYGAAATFDLLWIGCSALEWLARFDPDKADKARSASALSLGTAMAALVTEGLVNGHPAVGFVGAFISFGAKRFWALVLSYYSHPLDELTQGWVSAERASLSARLALAAARRQFARSQALHAAYERALSTGSDHTGPGPDKPSGRLDHVSADDLAAIRTAIEGMSGADPEEITKALNGAGFAVTTDTVQQVARQLADTRTGNVHSITPTRNVTDLVRDFVQTTRIEDVDAVFAAVQLAAPEAKRDTVRKAIDRVTGRDTRKTG